MVPIKIIYFLFSSWSLLYMLMFSMNYLVNINYQKYNNHKTSIKYSLVIQFLKTDTSL